MIAKRTWAIAALAVALLLVSASPAFAARGDVLYGNGFHQGVVNDYDSGFVIKTDTGGNPVAGGNMTFISPENAMDTLSLGGDTLWRWESAYGVPGSNARTADLGLDGAGNAYAVGWTDTPSGTDLVVLRTDAVTATATFRTYDSTAGKDDEAAAVTVAPDGRSLYVTGMSQDTDDDFDIVTIKYHVDSGTGVISPPVWTKRFNGPSNGFDGGFAIARRGTAVYVAGMTRRGSHHDDIVLLRYNAATGARQWVRYFDDSLHRNELPSQVLATSSGVYVAGSGKNGAIAGGDAMLLKFTSRGAFRWVQYAAGRRGMQDGWNDMAKAPGGYINVTGFKYQSATGDDLMTASYRIDGSFRWLRTWSTTGNHGEEGNGIVVDSNGKSYVGGEVYSASDGLTGGSAALVFCYNATSGKRVWHTVYNGPVAGGGDWANDIAISTDAVWVTGETQTALFGADFLMLKLQK